MNFFRTAVLMALFSLTLSSASAIAEAKPWTEKINLGMDLRYRHEMQDAEEDPVAPRHRHRIRFRLALDGEVDEGIRLYLRLMTGNKDELKTIASGNETLDDNAANDHFYLDVGYADVALSEQSHVQLGKMYLPFYRAGRNQMIWDNDITPEGAAYTYKRISGDHQYFLNAGGFWMDENHGVNDTADRGIFAAQIGGKFQVGEPKLIVALAHYGFANFKDGGLVAGVDNGNTTYTDANGDEVYQYDYNLIEGALELETQVADMASSVFLSHVVNQDPSKENKGFLLGFNIGKLKAKGDWQFTYHYKKVEKDAIVAPLSDSNFSDGFSDAQGHGLFAAYAMTNQSEFALTYFDAERNVSAPTANAYRRAHVDFIFKF